MILHMNASTTTATRKKYTSVTLLNVCPLYSICLQFLMLDFIISRYPQYVFKRLNISGKLNPGSSFIPFSEGLICLLGKNIVLIYEQYTSSKKINLGL